MARVNSCPDTCFVRKHSAFSNQQSAIKCTAEGVRKHSAFSNQQSAIKCTAEGGCATRILVGDRALSPAASTSTRENRARWGPRFAGFGISEKRSLAQGREKTKENQSSSLNPLRP